ncbi:MAG: hypothetical protein KKH67_05785 [candidate division Zixibacteria bacterium]|nr:hypothetical protein [candidate division Zixibacteria bacterium]MBU1469980.1 hypothetical protein [candidate division Zixibacteria bacterium]
MTSYVCMKVLMSGSEVVARGSFEAAECLRALAWLKPGGTAITSHTRLVPPITTIGKFTYPDDPVAMLRESRELMRYRC